MNARITEFFLSFIPAWQLLESEDLRRRRLLVSISFITVLYAAAFMPISYIMEYYVAVYSIMVTITVCLLIPFLLRSGISFTVLANIYLMQILGSEVVLYKYSGGVYGNPTDPEFVAFVPVIALLILGRKWAVGWMVLVVAHMVIFGVLELSGVIFPIAMKVEWIPRFMIMAATGHVVLMFILVNVFENTKQEILEKLKESHAIIEKEKKAADDLLLNILPEDVAGELKEKGYVDARHFKLVTVLFTDFKDFSKIAERLSPTELVGLINRYYRAFDAIIEHHRLEKIKTIGDSYMAAGGLPRSNSTNPEDVVSAAIAISDFVQQQLKLFPGDAFEVRIGIHTGPVVAGIVGVKKFAYDIWGDTVNTASRMEHHGEPGKINISEATYELVKEKFNCHYRGEIEAKNKGKLKMYFVD